jgi:hypothetical protein
MLFLTVGAYVGVAALVWFLIDVLFVKPLRFQRHWRSQGVPCLPFVPLFGQLGGISGFNASVHVFM